MNNIHIEGGILFMAPLTLLLLLNLCIIIVASISAASKKQINPFLLETIKQIGGLAFVWGTFSTLIGFYGAFDSISKIAETLPLNVIMGGLKVALITVVYGSIICIISLVAYLGLKIVNRKYTN